MLEQIKLSLGISHDKLDSDIRDVIAACLLDLSVGGVCSTDQSDSLVLAAVKMYCRAWYNFQGEGERYEKSYLALKNTMSMAGEYHAD